MGGGSWDTGHYAKTRSMRASKGVDDFAYSKTSTKTHSNLDPKRIRDKAVGKLESRDSDEHPSSTPVLVCFDVTGSNVQRAVEFQKKLPTLMELLGKYLTDAQVAVAANDDYNSCGVQSVQISDFESDNRVDEHIRSIRLVGLGGGNDGESYDLLLYAAARKMVLDSLEKRDKKGYLFMYADEPIFPVVKASEVKATFGDVIERDIPIAEIIEEARRYWNITVVWPQGGYDHAISQYKQLFGEESVIESQHPNLLCELIASAVGLYENKTTPDTLARDLMATGTSTYDACAVSTELARRSGTAELTAAHSGAGRAARL